MVAGPPAPDAVSGVGLDAYSDLNLNLNRIHLQVPTIPLLLTSSVVVHDHGVALADTQERMRLTLESIGEWLRIDSALKIVICDGSNFDFSAAVKTKFPFAAIECLYFENNQALVQQFGRGYGEGEIIRHALAHSQVLSQAGCFAKCTAKLWVENFSGCMKPWNGEMLIKGVFNNAFSLTRPVQFSYIDTRFYAMSTAQYKAFFINAHQHIDQLRGHGLEECFRDTFITNHLSHCLMPLPPVICGVGGGIGKYYKNTATRRLKERLRYRLIRRAPRFKEWFC